MGRIAVTIEADFRDIVPAYLANRRADIAQVQELLAQGDFNLIGRLAHRMRGSGGGYGFDGITDIGAAMEQAAAVGDAGEITRQSLALDHYLDRVEIVYV